MLGKEVCYVECEFMIGYQLGSVGKFVVLVVFFCELENIYVDCYDDCWMFMWMKVVFVGQWVVYDYYIVLFFDIEKRNFYKCQVVFIDEMMFYEWVDYMVLVSNNGVVFVFWCEVILMCVFQ